MTNQLTPEDTAKILTWAGIEKEFVYCERTDCVGLHLEWPALEGDFADVVAMKCVKRLGTEPVFSELHSYKAPRREGCYGFFIFDDTERFPGKGEADDPAQAIFAAVLAYLKQDGDAAYINLSSADGTLECVDDAIDGESWLERLVIGAEIISLEKDQPK